MLYVDYIICYINVLLRVSTNHVIIFKLFGRHKIQNRIYKLHLGSDSALRLVAAQCMAPIFIKHVNIKECLLVSSCTGTETLHYTLVMK